MRPIDVRNANWETIKERLTGPRTEVLSKLRERGPCTTRELAYYMGWEVLSVRPRVTELQQLGLVICTGNHHGEGVYVALTEAEAHAHFEALKQRAPAAEQLQLNRV